MGWPVLVGSLLGIALGVNAIPAPAIGVFMRSLQAEFGWTRAAISLGPTIMTIVLALIAPFVGWVADRVRAVWISVFGLVGLAASLLLFSRLGPDLRVYYAGCATLAFVGSGAMSLPYARAISASFVQARGFALAIATIGTGIAGILLPTLLAPYAARLGWRQGFIAIGVLVALAAPLVGLLISRAQAIAPDARTNRARRGIRLGTALRQRTFWTLALVFALIPIAVAGLSLHLLALLADAHVNPVTAGRVASLAGVALILGRLLTGWLVDRIFAPRVAAAAMACAASCIAGMAYFGAPAAPLGAIAIGLSLGAEIDLIGYMTARYFGMYAYGRLYGILYGLTLAGTASSLVLYGAIFDRNKTYTVALYGASAILLVSALLFLTLRRFDPIEEELA
jgi:sugar phosphate permease